MNALAVPYVDCSCEVGESPRWNAADGCLYWVDIAAGRYFRHRDGDPASAYDSVDPGLGKIGALAVGPSGRLRLFTAGCRVWECPFGGAPERVCELAAHEDRRFNDVLTDAGNAFCGVACAPGRPGELWLLRDGRFACLERSLRGMPNGMGISPDGKTFYFIVTDERRVYAYDYDRASGRISEKRVLCEDFEPPGSPDGMAVDSTDGSLYIALWDGGRLEHRDSDGRLLGVAGFPMEKVTSVDCADGRLFVTTANKAANRSAAFVRTGAGAVFCLPCNRVVFGNDGGRFWQSEK